MEKKTELDFEDMLNDGEDRDEDQSYFAWRAKRRRNGAMDEETLDELSRGTLQSYVKKAITRNNGVAYLAKDDNKNYSQGKGGSRTRALQKMADDHNKRFDKHYKRADGKAWNRNGVKVPASEYAKEETLHEMIKKGDTVIAQKGPHTGVKHEVIHDHGDGHFNVRPLISNPKKIKYAMGAAKAKGSDLKLCEDYMSEDTAKAIEDHKAQMKNNEMSSSRYFTSGAQRRDQKELERLKDKHKAAQGVKEETLDELSKKTLGRYIPKAADSQAHNYAQMHVMDQDDDYDQGEMNDAEKRVANRDKGIKRAVKKLTKEETLDEISKRTTRRYIALAKSNVAIKNDQAQDLQNRNDNSTKKGSARQAVINKYHGKNMRRFDSISQAAKRLTGPGSEKLDRRNKKDKNIGKIYHNEAKSADRKPEKYRAADGSIKIRMVPVDKNVEKDVRENMQSFKSYMTELSKETLDSYVGKAQDRYFKDKRPESNPDKKKQMKSWKLGFKKRTAKEKEERSALLKGAKKGNHHEFIDELGSGGFSKSDHDTAAKFGLKVKRKAGDGDTGAHVVGHKDNVKKYVSHIWGGEDKAKKIHGHLWK